MLTGRRPDTTHVGTAPLGSSWCWCQRTNCRGDQLFMTLPTYLNQQGFTTAGAGKLFHPDACKELHFSHVTGDDPRAWSYRAGGANPYTVEANVTQEQWGTIPGPHDPVFNGTMGLSFMHSNLTDEEETDGMLATDTVQRLANFSRDGIGTVALVLYRIYTPQWHSSAPFSLEDAIRSLACLQSSQQWVTEFMVSVRGC
jgi:hypothetical protein